jgi:hypothetical protein
VDKGLLLASAIFALSGSGLAVAKPPVESPGNSPVVFGDGGCGNSPVANGKCQSTRMSGPEIDGAGALTAAALLGGVLLLLGERRRRKA